MSKLPEESSRSVLDGVFTDHNCFSRPRPLVLFPILPYIVHNFMEEGIDPPWCARLRLLRSQRDQRGSVLDGHGAAGPPGFIEVCWWL